MPELFGIIFYADPFVCGDADAVVTSAYEGYDARQYMFARLKGKRYSARANQVGIVVMMLASLAIAVVMPESYSIIVL